MDGIYLGIWMAFAQGKTSSRCQGTTPSRCQGTTPSRCLGKKPIQVPGHHPIQVPGHNPIQVPGEKTHPCMYPGKTTRTKPHLCMCPGQITSGQAPKNSPLHLGHFLDKTLATQGDFHTCMQHYAFTLVMHM